MRAYRLKQRLPVLLLPGLIAAGDLRAESWRSLGTYELWSLFDTVAFEVSVDESRIIQEDSEVRFNLRMPGLAGGFFYKLVAADCATGIVFSIWSYHYDTDSWVTDSTKTIDLDRQRTWEPIVDQICRY